MHLDNVDSLIDTMRMAGRRVTVGDVAPVSPLNGAVWIEPNSIYPLWIYNSGVAKWLSPTMNFGGQMPQLVNTNTAVTRGFFGLQDAASFRPIVVRRLTMNMYLPPSGAHSGTNFFTFQPYWRSTSGAASTLNDSGGTAISFNTSTYTTANLGYTRGFQINRLYTDIVAVQIDGTCTGTPARPEVNVLITAQLCRS